MESVALDKRRYRDGKEQIMAGVARKHFVDGRWTTVGEVSEALGVKRQSIYTIMRHRDVGLQTAVHMIRDNLALGHPGRAERHMIDGRWMTVRQAAEMAGTTPVALHNWRKRNRKPDGTLPMMAEAVEAYRQGRVVKGGTLPREHRVGNRTMTTFEAAERLGVSVNAIRLHMSSHKASLAATIRYYEKRKMLKAEKEILAILKGK